MDIDKILEYQKLDSELFKLEKSIRDNADKKTASQMQNNAKVAQERSYKLNDMAKALEKEYNNIKSQFDIQKKKMDEIFAKDVDSLSAEEVEKLKVLKDKLSANLSTLERNFARIAESMNNLLSDFNKTRKAFQMAKEQYADAKAKFDKTQSELAPHKAELEKKLSSLEKGIDRDIVESYKKRRVENIFPVVVPLAGNCCGGCRTELSLANLSTLKERGVLTCEHCHRIIYVK